MLHVLVPVAVLLEEAEQSPDVVSQDATEFALVTAVEEDACQVCHLLLYCLEHRPLAKGMPDEAKGILDQIDLEETRLIEDQKPADCTVCHDGRMMPSGVVENDSV